MYLLEQPIEEIITMLDDKVELKSKMQAALTPDCRQFVNRRLLKVLNLKDLQIVSSKRGHKCIKCGVKRKIKAYLEDKDERDKDWTVTKYRNEVFRKQLDYVDTKVKPGQVAE